jgi:hypothetical protein
MMPLHRPPNRMTTGHQFPHQFFSPPGMGLHLPTIRPFKPSGLLPKFFVNERHSNIMQKTGM